MAKITKSIPIPKTIGACADLIYKIREQRKKAQKVVDEFDAQEAVIREHIINTLPKSDTTGVAGKVARVMVTTKTVCQVDDWDKLYAHIKKTGAFELMQRRVSDSSVKERWDQKKAVPGVKPLLVPTLSVNKL